MSVFKKMITLNSDEGHPTFFDITSSIKETIKNSNIKNGICVVISPHTTCSVFFEEFVHDHDKNGNEFLQVDLNDILKKIIPDHESKEQYLYPGKEHYEAVKSWPNAESYLPNGDHTALFNGDAHLKSTIIGSSETFEIDNGELGVGKTGYIYFVDFDRTRPRERKCKIIIMGE